MIKFIYADGDGVGDRLELLILEKKLDEACKHSESINSAIKKMGELLTHKYSATILIQGGDDLMFTVTDLEMANEAARDIRTIFKGGTNCTLSLGIGNSPESAINNLRKAKLAGRDQIISD